ncbi:MAG: hypothetical protein ACIAQF_03240 [Phycisphaerales bacterium JB065]
MPKRLSLVALLVSVVSSASFLSASAQAQIMIEGAGEGEMVFEALDVDLSFVGGGLGDITRRERNRTEPITAEEIERYNARLGLETAQVVFAGEMFAQYRDGISAINAEEGQLHADFASKMRKGREEGDGWDGEQMREAIEAMETMRTELAKKREALTKEFFADYKLVLTPEQLERWPEIERMRRRDRELAPGTFPGEGIDLVALCAEMDLAFDRERVSEGAEAALSDVLGRYEIEIDRLLLARIAVEAENPMAASLEQGRFGVVIDMESMNDWKSEHRDAASRLQKAQQKYVRLVCDLLDAESRAALEDRVMRLSYPQVFAKSMVESLVESIEGLADLTDEQSAEIARLTGEYERARGRVDQAWMAAIDQDLQEGGGSFSAPGHVQVFIVGTGEESELGKARAARMDLDRQWVVKLRGVLGEEQLERVPDPRAPHGTRIRTTSTIDPETGEESEVITVELQGGPAGE